MKLQRMNLQYNVDMVGSTWSPSGIPARYVASLKKSKKWSILPLYTCDGFVDWKIVHGSFNADLFVEFLEEHVLPHSAPFL
jgi:hypothetical protein